jgi:hypothetical protein
MSVHIRSLAASRNRCAAMLDWTFHEPILFAERDRDLFAQARILEAHRQRRLHVTPDCSFESPAQSDGVLFNHVVLCV